MASEQRNVDFVLEQMSAAGNVSARKMFGEYAIYCAGKLVALFCDDQLFMKPTDAGRALLRNVKEAPPYPGAKPYFLISGDQCEDGEWLSELVGVTERALPMPKPKLPRKSSKTKAKTPTKTARAKAGAKPKRVAKKPARRA
jgi:TfoX/Sxy family transcriptional regulator of competence genes